LIIISALIGGTIIRRTHRENKYLDPNIKSVKYNAIFSLYKNNFKMVDSVSSQTIKFSFNKVSKIYYIKQNKTLNIEIICLEAESGKIITFYEAPKSVFIQLNKVILKKNVLG
jgi:hypothetical protein